MKNIQISEPYIKKKEKIAVNKCLNQNEISTFGNYPYKLENIVTKYLKCKYSCATTSGTFSLLTIFKILNIKKDDLVITQSYTFIGTINSIYHSGGVPWLFDIDPINYCLNLDQIEKNLKKNTYKKGKFFFHKKTNKRVFAICPVLFNGHYPDFKRIKSIARKFNLKIIIDGAGAVFSEKVLSRNFNNFDALVISLNGNKNITSGGGGVICSNKKSLVTKCKKFVTNCTVSKKYNHFNFGLNLRITNLHAAVGYEQFKKFNFLKKKKIEIYRYYKKNIINKNLEILDSNDKKIAPWQILLIIKTYSLKNNILKNFKKNNISIENFWLPIHKQSASIKDKVIFEDMKNTDKISNKIYSIPNSINLKKEQIFKICKIINSS